MKKHLLLCYLVYCSFGFASAQNATYARDQFFGKWVWADYKIDGVSDVDAMADLDSTTYWLHSNGSVTFSMRRIPSDSDSVYADGKWKYNNRSNELVIDWKKGVAADLKAEVIQLDANTLVLRYTWFDGRKRVVKEDHFRKVP